MFCMNLKRLSCSSNRESRILEIGLPTDFRVVQHVGLSSDRTGFECLTSDGEKKILNDINILINQRNSIAGPINTSASSNNTADDSLNGTRRNSQRNKARSLTIPNNSWL